MGGCYVYTAIRLLLLICPFFTSSPVFKNLKFSSQFSQELWGQKSLNFVHLLTMGGCIVYTAIRLLLLICPFFTLSPVFKNLRFSSQFSQELWGQKSLNFVHLLTMGGCIVYTAIRLLLLICPFFTLSPVFKNLKFSSKFSQELWGQKSLNFVHLLTMGGCYVYTAIRLLLLICPFFTLSPVFKNLKFLSQFSQELWGQKSLNFVHLLTMGGCIVYTRIRLLPLVCPFISFFLSNYRTFTIFVTFFSGTVRPRNLKMVHMWTMGACIVYTGIRQLLLICCFICPFFSNFQLKICLSQLMAL